MYKYLASSLTYFFFFLGWVLPGTKHLKECGFNFMVKKQITIEDER